MTLITTAADIASRLSALVFFRAGPGSMRAPWRMLLGALAALAAFAASPFSAPFKPPSPSFGHGEVGLQIALADAYCGVRNRTFAVADAFEGLTAESARKPLSHFIPEQLGVDDLKTACAEVTPYPDFHEFSASAAIKGAIALPPEDTPLSLMAKMRGFIVALVTLAAALLALVRLGLVPIFAASAAAFVLTAPLETIAWTEYYYQLPAAALLIIAASAAFGLALATRPPLAVIALAAPAGAAYAYIENLRTTYGLAFAGALVVCAMFAAIVRLHGARGRRARAAAGLIAGFVSFAVAAGATDRAAFSSYRYTDAAPEFEYHLFWHPLVLGLALPGTAFTRAEGIAWNDSVGVDLARRINPETPTYGLVYEEALKTYYLGLWRDHPAEMIGAYLAKVNEFGSTHLTVLRVLGHAGPFSLFGLQGLALLGGLLAAFVATTFAFLRRGRPDMAILAVAIVALTVLFGLEYIIILTEFSATHNGASVIPFILLEWQLLAAAIVWFREEDRDKANVA
jgi:hypothetical protein